jgi:hypothetical protein
MYRGRRMVEVSSIVGSLGKHEQFDMNFMPLSKASAKKWKRIDRAFRLGQELPPVSLLEFGGDYFVIDGNYRVSVARFHGVEWIDAEIVELHARMPAAFAENTSAEGGIMLVVERATKKEERRRC